MSSGSIHVVGAGAIGCVALAHLASAGEYSVVACARSPIEEIVLQTPEGEIAVRPDVVTDPANVGAGDWTLLATKAHQTASAAAWLGATVASHTRVAVLQNGVEHRQRVTPFVGAATVVPVVVECPTTRTGPGRVTQHREARFIVQADEDGEAFRELFAHTRVRVELVSDFQSAAWTKLCNNVAGGAITALTRQGFGVVYRPGIERLARSLIRECIAVGRAEGATLPDDLEKRIVEAMRSAPPDRETSLLADLRLGRALEVDARNGAVVRLAEKHGIATPFNDAMVALLSAISDHAT